jgi:hypothetical protein
MMKRYTPEQACEILNAANETLERVDATLSSESESAAQQCTPRGLTPTTDSTAMDEWRADAEARNEAREAATAARQRDERRLTKREAVQLEARLTKLIADEHEAMTEIVAQTLGMLLNEWRLEIVETVQADYERAFAKCRSAIDELRAETAKLQGDSKAPLEVPKFLRQLQ